jgi:hypothetical protein
MRRVEVGVYKKGGEGGVCMRMYKRDRGDGV